MKTVSNESKINTLMIQLKKIFPNCYITNTGIAISLSDKLKGLYSCTINENYFNALLETGLFNNSKGIIYIPDINLMKTEQVDSSYKKIENDNEIQSVHDRIDKNNEIISKHTNWKKFMLSDNEEENVELIEDLFTKNLSLNLYLNDNNKNDFVIFTKAFLPSITKKIFSQIPINYSVYNYNEELNILSFDAECPWYKMYISYFYLPLD